MRDWKEFELLAESNRYANGEDEFVEKRSSQRCSFYATLALC
jgi:hypothetical protein